MIKTRTIKIGKIIMKTSKIKTRNIKKNMEIFNKNNENKILVKNDRNEDDQNELSSHGLRLQGCCSHFPDRD